MKRDQKPDVNLSSDADIKPAVKVKKKKGGPQPYAPGAKSSLAEMIVRIGIAGLPNHAEVCQKVNSWLKGGADSQTGLTPSQLRTQLDPRWGVRRELNKCAESLG